MLETEERPTAELEHTGVPAARMAIISAIGAVLLL